MQKILNSLPRGVLSILLFTLFIINCVIVNAVLFNVTVPFYKYKVSENPPDMFPVLILTKGEGDTKYTPQIVYSKYLNNFISENKKYTYIVPPNEYEELQKQIKKKNRENDKSLNLSYEDVPWDSDFKVEKFDNDKQFLKVECTWDDDRVNIGWYEASDKKIAPKYYQSYFGPGVGMNLLWTSFLITSGIWILVFILYKRRWKIIKQLSIYDES